MSSWRIPDSLIRIRKGWYETKDGSYEIEHLDGRWQVWQLPPKQVIGVYEGRSLRECTDWLGLT